MEAEAPRRQRPPSRLVSPSEAAAEPTLARSTASSFEAARVGRVRRALCSRRAYSKRMSSGCEAPNAEPSNETAAARTSRPATEGRPGWTRWMSANAPVAAGTTPT